MKVRPLEILKIMLFRFPPLQRAWAVWLMAVNACALFFIHTSYGQIALVAALAAMAVMAGIYARLRYVRLIGVGHIFWIPMLLWFAGNLPDRETEPLLFTWLIVLCITNAISLIIDISDLMRFIRGEREPHYVWKRK